MTHNQVPKAFDSHIYNHELPFEVVTGRSAPMKEVIIELLDDYGLHYFHVNDGSLMIVKRPNDK
jgi:hypothetical protein